MPLIELSPAFVRAVRDERRPAPPRPRWLGWGVGQCLECGRVVYVALDGKGFAAARVVDGCGHRERWWLPRWLEHLR